MARHAKTKFKLLRPDEVWHPRRGARPGNRNAWKTGFHSAEMRELRRRIRAFRLRAAAAMAAANAAGPPEGGPGAL